MSTEEAVRSRRRNRTILSRRHLLAVVGAAAAAFGQRRALAESKPAAITIDNFSFNPAVLEIPVGTTVTWTNRDDIPHTVAEKSIAWRSKPLDSDDTFSHTFDAAGEFQYFCTLHPHMQGTIMVKP